MRPLLPALFLLLVSGLQADGVADLKAALGRLQASAPLKGTLAVNRWSKNGEGKEAVERAGQASAWVEDGPQGLRVMWDRTLLSKFGQEGRATRKDPDAKTPATVGLSALTPRLVADRISAAESVAAELEHAVFQSEKAETWNGRPARLLLFNLTTGGLGKQERKYVKEFNGTLQVWIDEEGVPLGLSTKFSLKARAFLVVSFNQEQEESFSFQKVGDRLVCVKSELTSNGSGAGEKGRSHHTSSFTVQ
jgi:hypothetical protein